MLLVAQLSEEQKEIITTVKNRNNCKIISGPGTGKTALCLNIISETSDDTVIVMYNKALAASTSERLRQHIQSSSRKIAIHTYHSLLSSITRTNVEDDLQFIETMHKIDTMSLEPWPMRGFRRLIIDEAQDLRGLYFWLIKFLITRVATNAEHLTVMCLGQPEQLLYGFYATNRADKRFLLQMDVLLKDVLSTSWKTLTLTRSYRLSPQIANTLNLLFPRSVPIIGVNKNGPPVALHVCSTYKDVMRILMPYLPSLRPESDVFILCPSANEKSPLIKAVNGLVGNGLKIHVIRSGSLSESCPRGNVSFGKNKLQAMTFHASKGLESDTVIVINTRELFDGSNSLYVALSRACSKLIILQDARFVTEDALKIFAALSQSENTRIVVHRKLPSKLPQSREKQIAIPPSVETPATASMETKEEDAEEEILSDVVPSKLSVHDLFAFVDVEHISELLSYVTVTCIQPKLEVTIPDPIANEQKADDYLLHFDRLKNEQFGSYASDMVITINLPSASLDAPKMTRFQNDTTATATTLPQPKIPANKYENENQIHVNVLSYIGEALVMAAEFLLKPTKLPKIAYNLSLHVDPSHSLYAKMNHALHAVRSAIYDFDKCLTTNSDTAVGDECSRVEVLLPHFACLVAIHDSLHSFADRFALLPNFNFITKPSVFMRLRRFVQNIHAILSKYPPRITLGFSEKHETHVAYFVEETVSKNVTIQGKSTISIGNRAVIYCTHSATTGTNDILSAACMGEVAQVKDMFLINIYDGSAFQVTLKNRLEFVSVAVSAKLRMDPVLTDTQFIKLYKAEPFVWDKSQDFVDPNLFVDVVMEAEEQAALYKAYNENEKKEKMALFTLAFFLLVVLAIIVYFVWTTLVWATWNFTIPKLKNSINGINTPYDNIAWTTAAVFAFLIVFLAFPVGSLNVMGQLVVFLMGLIKGEKED